MTEGIWVGVCGYAGRMGSHVVRAVEQADDMTFVGGADVAAVASEESGVVLTTSLEEMLREARPDVVVDFSVPDAVYANVSVVLEAGVHSVVGTTGLTEAQRDELGRIAEDSGVGVLVAPNFAVGAVLMMQFAREAAKYFSGVEIIELHHDRKLDAPSGTALMTAGKIAETWQGASVGGAQEARGLDANGIRVHSVRLPGLVAHQEVLMGNPGESLTIRHDSFDRVSFMPGVLLGIRRIRERRGLVFGLENFLFG